VPVEIFYCPVWDGYDERAASLAAELRAAGIEATATKGEKSQFDVVRADATVFSKQRTGRWPEPGEVLRLLSW